MKPVSMSVRRFQQNFVSRWRSMSVARLYATWPDPRPKARSRRSERYGDGRFQSLRRYMHVIKKLMVDYDTLNWTGFWYLFSFDVTWPSNLYRGFTCGRRGVGRKSSLGLIHLRIKSLCCKTEWKRHSCGYHEDGDIYMILMTSCYVIKWRHFTHAQIA